MELNTDRESQGSDRDTEVTPLSPNLILLLKILVWLSQVPQFQPPELTLSHLGWRKFCWWEVHQEEALQESTGAS